MLKLLKWLLIGIGIVLVVATIVVVVWNVIQINALVAVADANKAAAAGKNANPRGWILLGAAGALIGGVVLGFGLGMPKRSFRSRLKEENAKEAAAAEAKEAVAG